VTAQTALGSVGRGLLAGLAGTVAMTLAQEAVSWARNRRSSVAGSLREPRTWAEAPPPAQVARQVAAVFGYRVTKRQAPLVGNAVHLGYGVALGGLYGLAQEQLRLHPLAHGAILGAAVWGLQYAVLPGLKVYSRSGGIRPERSPSTSRTTSPTAWAPPACTPRWIPAR
jgi:hypothetical protein